MKKMTVNDVWSLRFTPENGYELPISIPSNEGKPGEYWISLDGLMHHPEKMHPDVFGRMAGLLPQDKKTLARWIREEYPGSESRRKNLLEALADVPEQDLEDYADAWSGWGMYTPGHSRVKTVDATGTRPFAGSKAQLRGLLKELDEIDALYDGHADEDEEDEDVSPRKRPAKKTPAKKTYTEDDLARAIAAALRKAR